MQIPKLMYFSTISIYYYNFNTFDKYCSGKAQNYFRLISIMENKCLFWKNSRVLLRLNNRQLILYILRTNF